MRRPIKGRPRCKLHGGRNKAGADHPNFKGAGRSKYLTGDVATVYQSMRKDPDLASYEDGLATLELQVRHLMSKVTDRKGLTKDQEARLLNLVAEQRKMQESRTRRHLILKAMIPVEKVMALGIALAQAVRDEVQDEVVHRRIQQRFQRLMFGVGVAAKVVDAKAMDEGGQR